jgi:hypothetical protein
MIFRENCSCYFLPRAQRRAHAVGSQNDPQVRLKESTRPTLPRKIAPDITAQDRLKKAYAAGQNRAKTGGRTKGDPNESVQSKTTRLMSKMAASNKTQLAQIVDTVTGLALAGDAPC